MADPMNELARFMREGYRARIAKCWLGLVRQIRRKRECEPKKGSETTPSVQPTRRDKIAKAKAQLTAKWTLIPLAIIVLLGSGLVARDAIHTWIDWNYRTENPHAEFVPDSADLMVTMDLSRLRDPEVIDALNGWRQQASGTGETEDVGSAVSAWTGRNFSDDAIGKFAGQRITLMSGPWGTVIAIDAREKQAALHWLEQSEDGGWTGWLEEDVVWLAQPEAAEKITETQRYGLRTTIATTADYRRAREAHELKGAQAEIFVRWRQVPEPWKERLTTALDCAPNGWIGTRVRADGNGLRTESICRSPERTWHAKKLGEVDGTQWDIPVKDDVWIVTSHANGWRELKDRLANQSPAAAELAGAAQVMLEAEENTEALLELTTGAALVGWDSEQMKIHAAARLREGQRVEAEEALDRITEEVAGQWGATAARRREDGTYELRHGLWGGSRIEVTVTDGTINVNQPHDGDAITETMPSDAITVTGWTKEGATLLSRWLGGTVGVWTTGLGEGRAMRKDGPGLTIHTTEISWRE